MPRIRISHALVILALLLTLGVGAATAQDAMDGGTLN